MLKTPVPASFTVPAMPLDKRIAGAIFYSLGCAAAALASSATDPLPDIPAAFPPAHTAAAPPAGAALLELPGASTAPSLPAAPPALSVSPSAAPLIAPSPAILLPPRIGPQLPPNAHPLLRQPAELDIGSHTPAPVIQNGNAAAQSAAAKNPDVLFEPMHLGAVSMMFKKSDMNIIAEALEVYDKSNTQKSGAVTDKDDLSSLINTLKSHDVTAPNEPPPPLPNLYLGSIVYYSQNHWSVWINGRKLINTNNSPTGELYIASISRTEIELLWHPKSLIDTAVLWRQLTANGAHPLPGIMVDEKKGTIALHLRTNQTFLPRSLAIREGLVKSVPAVASAPAPEASSAAREIMNHPFNMGTK